MGSEELNDWSEIENEENWRGLILGNGASISVSKSFQYASLFEEANLSQQSEKLFEEEDTENFELILRQLMISKEVCTHLGVPTDKIKRTYEEIRKDLLDVLQRVHPRQYNFSFRKNILRPIHKVVSQFDTIFSLNYDLLLYWAMAQDFDEYFDFFKGAQNTFHRANVSKAHQYPSRTEIWWLHGGLHLYSKPPEVEGKLVSSSGNRILDTTFGRKDRVPLFVAEGTAAEKRRSIRGSKYLSAALDHLEGCRLPLVIFGSSLGEPDQHLIDAISDPSDRSIAISVYPKGKGQADIQELKATIAAKLENPARLWWFDSTTHPLGSPSLNIDS